MPETPGQAENGHVLRNIDVADLLARGGGRPGDVVDAQVPITDPGTDPHGEVQNTGSSGSSHSCHVRPVHVDDPRFLLGSRLGRQPTRVPEHGSSSRENPLGLDRGPKGPAKDGLAAEPSREEESEAGECGLEAERRHVVTGLAFLVQVQPLR